MTIANVGVIIAVLLALVALLPFVRGGQIKATRDALRDELAIEKELREAQEVRCTAMIAELRGQLRVVNEQFARIIAVEVVKAIEAKG